MSMTSPLPKAVPSITDLMATIQQSQAAMAQLMAENQALKERMAQPRGKISYKVSEKGAVSIVGLRRFPITLYRGEVERILADHANLVAFIKANANKLSVKGE